MADHGQSTSLIAGLCAIDPKSDGALILAGDQPMIRPELINSLVNGMENRNALIVAPSFREQCATQFSFDVIFFPSFFS